MRLQDIMTTPVETTKPDTTVAEARTRMTRREIHHLVVLEGSKVVGVVSARDLAGRRLSAPITEVMSAPVATARPRSTIREAANLLRGRGVGCLPVIDAGTVVGMVTISDLLELLGRGVERPVERSTRWTLSRRGARKRQPSEDRRGFTYAR